LTTLFVLYGVAGGLAAAIVTDFFQGILTFIFSFLLLPIVLAAVGGMDGLRETIQNEEMFSLVAPSEIGLFYIVVLAINALFGIVAQPHVMGNCAAGRNEQDGQIGFMMGNFIKRVCTMAWAVTGLAAVAFFASRAEMIEPDEVYGRMARHFLPQLMPGLLGIFIASMLAAVMSSCDSIMIAASALFTENLYRPLFRGGSERHYIWIGRCFSVLAVSGGIFFAYIMPNVVRMLEVLWMITPMMGIAFWIGVIWRRATPAGAWAATLTGFGVLLLTGTQFFIQWLEKFPAAEQLRMIVDFSGGEPAIYLPWQMVFYLSAGLLMGIVVSLLTRPVAHEKLENFYGLLRTPARTGEVLHRPCTLPEGVEPPPRRQLFPGTQIEIPIPSRFAAAGFFGGWVLVVLLIAVFYWYTQ
jgi:Na+/proline symporter